MKKLLSIYFLILCGLLLAQEYRPMLKTDNLWRVSRGISFGDGNYSITEIEYKILNETVYLEGKIFNKVDKRIREQIENSTEFTEWTEWSLDESFYLREDLTEKKVYVYWSIYRDENPPGEYLLYDLNLTIGETIPLVGFGDFVNYPFTEHGLITDITYEIVFGLENVKTIHTNLISTHGILKIYEGIGASTGLITITDVIDYISNLEYFATNLNVLDNNLPQAKIYPNPFTNQIQIDSSKPIHQLQLFDLSGKLILSKSNLLEFNSKIGSMPIGAYLLKILYKNNTQETIKLMKK